MSSNASTQVRKPANRKFGSQRGNKRSQVVRMRTKDLMSWAQIGEALEIAPRTARRLFQEKAGAHTHHGLLPGKGGRLPQHGHSEDITALWSN